MKNLFFPPIVPAKRIAQMVEINITEAPALRLFRTSDSFFAFSSVKSPMHFSRTEEGQNKVKTKVDRIINIKKIKFIVGKSDTSQVEEMTPTITANIPRFTKI